MPAITQLPSSGAISMGDIRGRHGVKSSPGQGYMFGPSNAASMFYNYVPALVTLPLTNYYGADPEKGTVPSSGTLSLSNFHGTRPSARFYCGYETSSVNSGAKRYGYGDAFYQAVDPNQSNRIYSEGSRFIQPERGITNAQLGSISHRSILSAGSDNVWVTGVQVQRMQGDSGTTYVVVFLETNRGNGFNLTYLNASFSNVVLRFGGSTFSLPNTTKSQGSVNYPMDGLYGNYENEFGTNYFVPPYYSWAGGPNTTGPNALIHTSIWNAFVNAYNTGTPGYIYFT